MREYAFASLRGRQFPQFLAGAPDHDAGAIFDDADHRLADLQPCPRSRDERRRILRPAGHHRPAAICPAVLPHSLFGPCRRPSQPPHAGPAYHAAATGLRRRACLFHLAGGDEPAGPVQRGRGPGCGPRLCWPRAVCAGAQPGAAQAAAKFDRPVLHLLAGWHDRRAGGRRLSLCHLPSPALCQFGGPVRAYAHSARMYRQGSAFADQRGRSPGGTDEGRPRLCLAEQDGAGIDHARSLRGLSRWSDGAVPRIRP